MSDDNALSTVVEHIAEAFRVAKEADISNFSIVPRRDKVATGIVIVVTAPQQAQELDKAYKDLEAKWDAEGDEVATCSRVIPWSHEARGPEVQVVQRRRGAMMPPTKKS